MGYGPRGGRTWIDDCAALDLASLKKWGYFSHGQGCWGKEHWKQGGKTVLVVAIELQATSASHRVMRLRYRIRPHRSPEPVNCDYSVGLTATPCNYGGQRWWFQCPLQGCHTRCRVLYLPPGAQYFGCRKCHRLAYSSSQRSGSTMYEFLERPAAIIDACEEQMRKCRWGSAKWVRLEERCRRAERKSMGYLGMHVPVEEDLAQLIHQAGAKGIDRDH